MYSHPILSDGNVFVVVALHDKVPCVWEQFVHNAMRTGVMVWGKTDEGQSEQDGCIHQPMTKKVNQVISPLINQSINQSIDWSINHSINWLFNQPIDQMIDQPVHQLIDRSISQSNNRSISQSTNWSISQSVNQPIDKSVNQPIAQSINQLMDWSINQSISQSTSATTLTCKVTLWNDEPWCKSQVFSESGPVHTTSSPLHSYLRRRRKGGGGVIPLLFSLNLDLSDFSVFSGFEEEWDSERKQLQGFGLSIKLIDIRKKHHRRSEKFRC